MQAHLGNTYKFPATSYHSPDAENQNVKESIFVYIYKYWYWGNQVPGAAVAIQVRFLSSLLSSFSSLDAGGVTVPQRNRISPSFLFSPSIHRQVGEEGDGMEEEEEGEEMVPISNCGLLLLQVPKKIQGGTTITTSCFKSNCASHIS